MMINETVFLLSPIEDCRNHRLSRQGLYDCLRLGSPFDEYVYKPLQKIFSKVSVYDYIKRMTEIGVKGVNEEVIELVRREHPKYILWICSQYELRESTFDIIRQEGGIVIAWFGDDEFRFDDYSKWWIPHLDYCITKTADMVQQYRELGGKAIQAILYTGIPINRDWSNIEEKYDVSFVGAKIHDREQYINELKNRNIPVHLSGERWGRDVPYLSLKEMTDIFGASKINLNFARTGDNQLGIKGRIFEVCLAGGFLLTEYSPGTENYFEIDKEIVCFRNAEEMVDKITYYLNHEEERRAIAQAGWERATGEYTSFHMVSKVFRQIEEDISAKGKEGEPRELKMPMRIRKRIADYHLKWGVALSMENHKGLWKDALALSIRYYPFNIRAWYHYILGFLPYSVRITIIKLYRALYRKASSTPC